ncbi:MAG: hypothetical protein FWF12_11445 [Betaproteobacteria bacterium]|nr:hypothetical protein [Betaproteobacteria bacterium]
MTNDNNRNLLLAVVGLRAAGLAVLSACDENNPEKARKTQKAGQALYLLADLLSAGKATDDHMAVVAEKLKNREISKEDWDDVFARIEIDSARLQRA